MKAEQIRSVKNNRNMKLILYYILFASAFSFLFFLYSNKIYENFINRNEQLTVFKVNNVPINENREKLLKSYSKLDKEINYHSNNFQTGKLNVSKNSETNSKHSTKLFDNPYVKSQKDIEQSAKENLKIKKRKKFNNKKGQKLKTIKFEKQTTKVSNDYEPLKISPIPKHPKINIPKNDIADKNKKVTKKIQNSNHHQETTVPNKVPLEVGSNEESDPNSNQNNLQQLKSQQYEKEFKEHLLTVKNHIDESRVPKSLPNFNVYHYPYNLISKCESKCNNQENYDIIFLVKTYINNYEKRLAVRQTWGLEDPFPDCKVRRVFLMAVDHKNDSVRVETLKEQELFGDIILADYHDSYFNNSIKCMMGINWAREFCPNSKFYVLADDDAYISTKNLMKFLKDEKLYNQRKSFSLLFLEDDKQVSKNFEFKFFGGYVHPLVPPIREDLWGVTPDEYPYNLYPDYLNGHTMVMTRNVLDDFSRAAHFTKFFKIDDVYLGFVAAQAGIVPFQIPGVTSAVLDFDNLNEFDDIISSHYINASQLLYIHALERARGNA